MYRIVTGQTNAEDYAAILDKYGWDAGKIADLDDNSKMGELARVLNQSRETREYYATKSGESRCFAHSKLMNSCEEKG